MTTIDLRLGDCLTIMPTIEAGSIDAIITDLPYGTTACSWIEKHAILDIALRKRKSPSPCLLASGFFDSHFGGLYDI